jgi:repressor LexA
MNMDSSLPHPSENQAEKSLTEKQKRVLEYLEQVQGRTGMVPSTREIQGHFGFASQTAALNHLRALERKGVIRREAGKARAVSIVSQLERERILDVPVYGQIAAGFGEAAMEELREGVVSIDSATLGLGTGAGKRAKLFALRVRGNSMIGAQIVDGDLAILEQRPGRHGEIVAALIDGETTLKRLMVEAGGGWLKAENPDFPELHPAEELVVQGVLVSLVRRFGGRRGIA